MADSDADDGVVTSGAAGGERRLPFSARSLSISAHQQQRANLNFEFNLKKISPGGQVHPSPLPTVIADWFRVTVQGHSRG